MHKVTAQNVCIMVSVFRDRILCCLNHIIHCCWKTTDSFKTVEWDSLNSGPFVICIKARIKSRIGSFILWNKEIPFCVCDFSFFFSMLPYLPTENSMLLSTARCVYAPTSSSNRTIKKTRSNGTKEKEPNAKEYHLAEDFKSFFFYSSQSTSSLHCLLLKQRSRRFGIIIYSIIIKKTRSRKEEMTEKKNSQRYWLVNIRKQRASHG